MITAEEFERQYAERSGITVEELRALGRVVRPCYCGEEICEGWQSLSREAAESMDQKLSRCPATSKPSKTSSIRATGRRRNDARWIETYEIDQSDK